jgi:hypothetical protein
MDTDIHSIFADFEARLWAGLDARFKAQEEFIHERYRKTDAKLDDVVKTQREVLLRLGRLEQGQGRIRRDQGGDAETVAHVQVQLDRVDERVQRIEKRLDLIDDPAG